MKKKNGNRNKSKKITAVTRKSILSALIALMLYGTYWITEQASKPELPRSDQPAALYSNQTRQDLLLTFSQAISAAKQSILLLVYSLSDETIINALKSKAEQGVQVRVIHDGKSTPFAERRLGPKVEVLRRFAPNNGLMHMKILVVDGEQVWIGSANMTTDSLRMYGNLVMALNSPELAKVIQTKANTVSEEGPCRKCSAHDFLFNNQKLELWFLPSSEDATLRIKKLIDSAKKTIRVAMFTWSRMDFAQALVEASKRGVQAEVVVDHYTGKGASAPVVKYLQKNGIFVGLGGKGSLMHHKFLYVDGKVLVNGSTNWTKAAFIKNDDCFVVLNDLSESQRKQMDRLWKAIKSEATE